MKQLYYPFGPVNIKKCTECVADSFRSLYLAYALIKKPLTVGNQEDLENNLKVLI